MEDSSGSPGNKSRVIPHKHKTLNPRHRGQDVREFFQF